MPHRRFDWHERIKAIEREYWAARIAVDQLSDTAARDPGVLGGGAKPRDLEAADENLEGTYLIRMFAEFETGVRSYWRTIRPNARTPVETMLDRVGDRCEIPVDVIRGAQAVREYRNKLVHDRDQEVEAVTIGDARSHLATYFARLPLEWGIRRKRS
jgi:hypothetical protein